MWEMFDVREDEVSHPCSACKGYPDCINGCLRLTVFNNATARAWKIVLDVIVELNRAESLHAPMMSKAHALGVIREEYLEFEREVMLEKSEGLNPTMTTELVQLAAMCVRAIQDLC
jgi:hypothetical protein